MSPYLPCKPEDIVRNCIDAANAGATVVHIHARDPESGFPSPSLDLYTKIIEGIRAENKDLIICITTGGGSGMSVDDRLSVVPHFKPELSSMNCGSINWGLFPIVEKISDWKFDWEKPMYEHSKGYIFQNTFEDIERMLVVMDENGTKPEIECYDTGHLYNAKFMADRGFVKGKPYLQFVMGINGGIGASVDELVNMKRTADSLFGVGGYNWSAFGGGRMEFPICTTNLFLGGHVRVGMEDNLFVSKGVLAKSNGELVEKMVRIMRDYDFEPATPDEGREMLGITKK
jgi:uncharacterized protein (DUF849 family)